MTVIVTAIPTVLQTLFPIMARGLGRATGFIQRQGTLLAEKFALTFSLSLVQQPNPSLRQLAAELGMSSSGLCQRLQSRRPARFLRALLSSSLGQLVLDHQPPTLIPLLNRFRGVYLSDCTTVSLPKSLVSRFRGCGGGTDANQTNAAVKILLRTNLSSGKVSALKLANGRISDIKMLKKLPRLPRGALHIADMGFFDTTYFAKLDAQGVFWLSRIPVGIAVKPGDQWQDLVDWLITLKRQKIKTWDGPLTLVKSAPLRARVVVQRCPPSIAAERRRKLKIRLRRDGKTPSKRMLEMCNWWLLATSVPAKQLQYSQAWELYRTRWQIELIFKRWKSLGQLKLTESLPANRAECELYGRLLGVLLVDWMALHQGGSLSGKSVWHAFQAVLKELDWIIRALEGKLEWEIALAVLREAWEKIPQQPIRKKKPSTRQRLFL